MVVALVAQHEKEAMGVVVALGAIALTVGPLRTGRYAGRPQWPPRTTRRAAAAALAGGIAIAVASFVVNREPGTDWGTARDKLVLAAWLAAVAVLVALAARRAQRARKGIGHHATMTPTRE